MVLCYCSLSLNFRWLFSMKMLYYAWWWYYGRRWPSYGKPRIRESHFPSIIIYQSAYSVQLLVFGRSLIEVSLIFPSLHRPKISTQAIYSSTKWSKQVCHLLEVIYHPCYLPEDKGQLFAFHKFADHRCRLKSQTQQFQSKILSMYRYQINPAI